MDNIKTVAIAIVGALAILLVAIGLTYFFTAQSVDRKWKGVIAQAETQQKAKELEWQKKINKLTAKQTKELADYVATHKYDSCSSDEFRAEYLKTITIRNQMVDTFNQQ